VAGEVSAVGPSSPDWQPVREPLQVTLLRTGTIALVVGGVVAQWWGGLGRWPLASLLALWFSLGGHWVELWFLNWLRPRLSVARPVQLGARIAVWWIGGTGLALCMAMTSLALGGPHPTHWPWWSLGGLAFIGVELVVHLVLQLSGRPSFYDGRG
jgi:hypothetical protein